MEVELAQERVDPLGAPRQEVLLGQPRPVLMSEEGGGWAPRPARPRSAAAGCGVGWRRVRQHFRGDRERRVSRGVARVLSKAVLGSLNWINLSSARRGCARGQISRMDSGIAGVLSRTANSSMVATYARVCYRTARNGRHSPTELTSRGHVRGIIACDRLQ